MTGWSLFAGLLGILGSGFAAVRLAGRSADQRPEIYWFLGLAALLPAWVIAFFSLLGRTTGPRPDKAMTASWILSSSIALLGVIVTDAALKRLRESGRDRHPVAYWLLGVAALLLGWGIALFALGVLPRPK